MQRITRIKQPIPVWLVTKIPLPGKTAQVLFMFVLLTLVPYAIPSLGRYRVLIPDSVAGLIHRIGGEPGATSGLNLQRC